MRLEEDKVKIKKVSELRKSKNGNKYRILTFETKDNNCNDIEVDVVYIGNEDIKKGDIVELNLETHIRYNHYFKKYELITIAESVIKDSDVKFKYKNIDDFYDMDKAYMEALESAPDNILDNFFY